jgi:transcription antitermination factor NusG
MPRTFGSRCGSLQLPRVSGKNLHKRPKRDFKVGDKVRVNLHHGKIEDAIVRAVIQDDDGIKLQVDVVGLDLTALIDTRQVVE